MKRSWLLLGVLFVGVFCRQAQALSVDVRPTQITIHGEVGDTIVRTIQLRISEDINELQAVPGELLYDRQARALPMQLISVAPPVIVGTTTPKMVAFKLEIRLIGVPPGEYTGDLPFIFKGGEAKLPIRISVRHSFPLPLLVLLLGVGAGMGLSAYRARGRPRDQVLVRVGLVRAFVQRDRTMSQGILPVYGVSDPKSSLQNPFKTRIESALMDVEMSLQAERWDEARLKMDQSDALLRKWIQGRLGWIDQLAYLARLQLRMDAKIGSGRYLQSVRTAISDLIANAPSQESPQTLRDAAQQIASRIDDYERSDAKLVALGHLRTKLPPPQEQPWIAREADLRSRLESMRPDERAASDLIAEIDRALLELSTEVRQAVEIGAAPEPLELPGSLGRTALEGEELPSVEPVPESHLGSLFNDTPAGASSRLRWFLYVTYAVALVLLAGTGFNEAYVKKLTFGADLWADYFALLIWGFGAEATRDSVTTTLRGWGTPIDGKPAEMK